VSAVAMPHPYKGEVPMVFLTLKAGEVAKHPAEIAAVLMAYAKQHLNTLAMPVGIEIMETLPKTLVGKLDKKPLIVMAKQRAVEMFGHVT
jgi:long-chain acyl-CoA synthetase